MSHNLPPGVTENMLPGNTPADLEFDEIIEAIYDQVKDALYRQLHDIVVDAIPTGMEYTSLQAYVDYFEDELLANNKEK